MKVLIGPYPKYNKKTKKTAKRIVKVTVHGYDTWNADLTIAQLVLPLLLKFKKHLQSAPFTDDSDVPENIRSDKDTKMSEEDKKNGATDKFFFKRWEWIVNEMIYAFRFHNDSRAHMAGQDPDSARAENGLRLFAKYYSNLWN